MSIALRRIPFLLLALFALALVAPATSAQWEGAHFKTEAVHAAFSFADPATGYVTEITVYAADDQLYTEKGDGGGAPERDSVLDVAIEQYDPTCAGGPKQTPEEEPPGDPSCFYRGLEGGVPCKFDACPGLPEDAFVVSNHQLDGAWLTTTVTLVEWDPEGNTKTQEATIHLTWAPTSDVYRIHENWLQHTPPASATGHVNAFQRDAVATGTIAFDGASYEVTSHFARIADFQQVNT